MSATVNFQVKTELSDVSLIEDALTDLELKFEKNGDNISLRDGNRNYGSGVRFVKKGKTYELDVRGDTDYMSASEQKLPAKIRGYSTAQELANAVIGVYKLIEMQRNLEAQGYVLDESKSETGAAAATRVLTRRTA